MTFLRRMLAPLPVWPRILLAILCFLTGAVLIVQPFLSLSAIITLLTIALVAAGGVEFVRAGKGERGDRNPWLHIVLGIVWVTAGVLVLAAPALTIRVLVLAVAMALAVHGATQFVQAFRASGAETLAGAGFGIARIILAALALTWPDVTVPIRPIEAPLLIAQGETHDLVLPELQAAYVAARCADGWELDYRTYPGLGHMEVVSEGSPLVGELLAWTADRFAGKPVPATACTPS